MTLTINQQSPVSTPSASLRSSDLLQSRVREVEGGLLSLQNNVEITGSGSAAVIRSTLGHLLSIECDEFGSFIAKDLQSGNELTVDSSIVKKEFTGIGDLQENGYGRITSNNQQLSVYRRGLRGGMNQELAEHDNTIRDLKRQIRELQIDHAEQLAAIEERHEQQIASVQGDERERQNIQDDTIRQLTDILRTSTQENRRQQRQIEDLENENIRHQRHGDGVNSGVRTGSVGAVGAGAAMGVGIMTVGTPGYFAVGGTVLCTTGLGAAAVGCAVGAIVAAPVGLAGYGAYRAYNG